MGNTKHISIRIDSEILARVDSEAKRMRWSRNAALQTCVEFGLVDLELERGPKMPSRKSEEVINASGEKAEVGEKAAETGSENGQVGNEDIEGGRKDGRARPSKNEGELPLGKLVDRRSIKKTAANLKRGGFIDAEIATGGSAGVAADIILGGDKRGVGKGATYVNKELLHGNAVTKAAAGEIGAAWFPTSMCPHGWVNSFACERVNGGCKR